MTRRLIAACCCLSLLGTPAAALAQDPDTPTSTAQGTTSVQAPTTAAPAPAPTTTAPAPAPTTTAPAPAPTTPAPAATAPAPAESTAAASEGRDTAAIVLLLVVGGLVLAALVLWGLARWQAWEPPWLLRWRHATGEAGWRVGNAWSEFSDWLRLGR